MECASDGKYSKTVFMKERESLSLLGGCKHLSIDPAQLLANPPSLLCGPLFGFCGRPGCIRVVFQQPAPPRTASRSATMLK